MIKNIPALEDRCDVCSRRSFTKLCDFVTGSFKTSIDFQEYTTTCDAQLCDECAINIGPNFDFCPCHAKKAKEKLSSYK